MRYSCLWRNTSGGAAVRSMASDATIWLNHRMMRAVMKKKMMVLPTILQVILNRNEREMWRLGLLWMRWLHLTKVLQSVTKCYKVLHLTTSDQCAKKKKKFPQTFFWYLYWIINIKVQFPFNCAFRRLITHRSYQFLLNHN